MLMIKIGSLYPYKNMEIRVKTQENSELKDIKIIICLYSYFKNSPQKLKIVCDWDEVIQPLEPRAYYELSEREGTYYDAPWWMPNGTKFEEWFQNFWNTPPIYYSDYGSHSIYAGKIMLRGCLLAKTEKGTSYGLGTRSIKSKVDKIKSETNFYQEAPFLTIAKELLMLIKANKVEKLILLTAYDKSKFPNEDDRKKQIFKETFGKFPNCFLQLISFDNESRGVNKADWIKQNAPGFDIVIDDNPNICKSIAESIPNIKVIAPYYPAIVEKHHLNVTLVKTSVSDWDKKNFK